MDTADIFNQGKALKETLEAVVKIQRTATTQMADVYNALLEDTQATLGPQVPTIMALREAEEGTHIVDLLVGVALIIAAAESTP